MMRPNTFGQWTRRTGFNDYGEPLWRGPYRVPCAVVNVTPTLTPTPIRTDASASNAGSDEIDARAIVLVPGRYALKIGDKFTIDRMNFRITGVEARRRVVDGKVDHLEVSMEAWQINGN